MNAYSAFNGGVTFYCHFETLGGLIQAEKLEAAMFEAGVPERLRTLVSNFALFLSHTDRIVVAGETAAASAELASLEQFWNWYTDAAASPPENFGLLLWDWRLNRLGSASLNEWDKAYAAAQATAYSAPRAVLPDDRLTAEEKRDPNSFAGEKPSDRATAGSFNELR